MIRQIYTSAWGMQANSRKMDVISNNIANVNTNAYKKDEVVFHSFSDVLMNSINTSGRKEKNTGEIGTMQFGSDVGLIHTYYNQGKILNTENKLDLAISDSPGSFFTVGVVGQNGDITEYYTRDGAFTINSAMQLVTSDGYLVMGQKGPITLESSDFIVEKDGTIIQNGEVVDKLLIRTFADTGILRKQGNNLVSVEGEAEELEFTGAIIQGGLEQSNVNAVEEMVNMISVLRAYETNQRLLLAEDSTLEKAVNEVGALR